MPEIIKKHHILILIGLLLSIFAIISSSSAASTINIDNNSGSDANNGTAIYGKSTTAYMKALTFQNQALLISPILGHQVRPTLRQGI